MEMMMKLMHLMPSFISLDFDTSLSLSFSRFSVSVFDTNISLITIIFLVMTRLVFDIVCGANEGGEDLLDQLLGRKRRNREREEEEFNDEANFERRNPETK